MKKTLLLSFAVLGLAGMAGCASDTPPPAPAPVVEAAPPPAPPAGMTVVYACAKKAGDLTAVYMPGSPEMVQLSMADQTMTASRVRTKGRSKAYRGDGVSATVMGRTIVLTTGGHTVRCVAHA